MVDRGLHQITFENGLMIGYSNREHEIPEGFCAELNNFTINQDGTLKPREGLMRTDADNYTNGVEWDVAVHANRRIFYGDIGDGDELYFAYRVGLAGAEEMSPGSVPAASKPNFTTVGKAATFGDQIVVPYMIPNGNISIGEPIEYPRAGNLAPLKLVIGNIADDPEIEDEVDLNLVNGHEIVQEALEQQAPVFADVFARLVAITWKSRIFIVAGTRVSYSAAGDPTDYSVSGGGGFFNLDTDSQVVGAFVLDDQMYIATRRELFSFSFSEDPAGDGQLQSIANIYALGAAEYDNVGYIAVREGLYRVVNGQLTPTFVPSSSPQMSFQTFGVAKEGETQFRIEIPWHCSPSKVGDQILLAGIGTNLEDALTNVNKRILVFNSLTESWVTWSAGAAPDADEHAMNRWFNLVNPMIRIPVQNLWGSEQYIGTNIRYRNDGNHAKERSFAAVNPESARVIFGTAPSAYPRYRDFYQDDDGGDILTYQILPSMETGYLHFEAPISHKRLHRLWMTGKFLPVRQGSNPYEDPTDVRIRVYSGPNDDIEIVRYSADGGPDLHITPNLFDISPRMLEFFGALRFDYLSFRLILDYTWGGYVPLFEFDESQQYMDIALSSLYADVTEYGVSNRAY